MKNDSHTKSLKSLVKLRGHHLICLHFFHGEGYNIEYIENLSNVLKIATYKDIEICDGIDDVCRKCPYVKDEKCSYKQYADEEIKEMDEKAMRLLNLKKEMKTRWHRLKEGLPGIFKEWSKSYCIYCGWREACEKDDFYKKLKGGY